jgi:SAM-dependent methyltransferase
MNRWLGQIAGTVAAAGVILALGMLQSSCRNDSTDPPHSFILPGEERVGGPATEETALPSSEQAKPPAGRQPAVVFVAYVATPPDVIERMMKLARVAKDDVVYDLGCGDGRIVVMAAQKYGCRAVGYDLDPLRVREAIENARKNQVAQLVTIEQRDVLKADVRPASIVTLYLGTEINARLIPQLRQLRPGARIVSHDFGLGKIPPDKVVEMTSHDDGRKHTLYLWTCPLSATGN